jgi:hypothetical protein
MELNSQRIATREKLILVGLYLSKYDSFGLKRLGFDTFTEAFNVFGYAMGSKAASIKNYRDEFDPLFPNRRKGSHKRKTRDYCLRVSEEYENLDLESFTGLVESFVGYDENALSEFQRKKKPSRESNFAQRLITGLAAERYFESVRSGLSQFKGYAARNTTSLGCGYDFRMEAEAGTSSRGGQGLERCTRNFVADAEGARGRDDPNGSLLSFRRKELPRNTVSRNLPKPPVGKSEIQEERAGYGSGFMARKRVVFGIVSLCRRKLCGKKLWPPGRIVEVRMATRGVQCPGENR